LSFIHKQLKLRPVSGAYHKSVVDSILEGKIYSDQPSASFTATQTNQQLSDLDEDLYARVFTIEENIETGSVASPNVSSAHRNIFRRAVESAHRRLASWSKDKTKAIQLVGMRKVLGLDAAHQSAAINEQEDADDMDEADIAHQPVEGHDSNDQTTKVTDSTGTVHSTKDIVNIEVSDIMVRKLKSSSFFSRPHPYVVIQSSAFSQRKKTSVAKSGTDASWTNEKLVFQITKSHLLSRKHDKLVISVYDKEYLRRKNLLGTLTVSLAGIDFHEIDSWFALEGNEATQSGEIHVKICIDEASSNTIISENDEE
jgi:hypothetical protein